MDAQTNKQTNKQKLSQVPTDNNLPYRVLIQICPIKHLCGNVLVQAGSEAWCPRGLNLDYTETRTWLFSNFLLVSPAALAVIF